MKRKILLCMCICFISLQIFAPFSAYADGIKEDAPSGITITMPSDVEYYEKTLYLYADGIREDGNINLSITDDLNSIPEPLRYNWNIAVSLYATRISTNYYRITAEAYNPSVLIHTFWVDINYGNGVSSGVVAGINQPPYINGYSFDSIATAYYLYPSSGTYSLTFNSVVVRVCDVLNPSYFEDAYPVWSTYVFTAY